MTRVRPTGLTRARTKALLALSCLVRHHGRSLDAFRAAGGLRLLAAALGDGAPRAQRKALQLLREARAWCQPCLPLKCCEAGPRYAARSVAPLRGRSNSTRGWLSAVLACDRAKKRRPAHPAGERFASVLAVEWCAHAPSLLTLPGCKRTRLLGS